MNKEIKLKAVIRKTEEKINQIKQEGFVPAVLYGPKMDNIILKINKIDLEKAYKEAGENNLVDLEIEGKDKTKVLFKDIQKDIIKNTIIHVDFYNVDMTKKINAEIPLNFVGESQAIKSLGGFLSKEINALPIECLPNDLIDHLDVDISKLETFNDVIRVKDIELPENIEPVNDKNDVVATVSRPRINKENAKEKEEEKQEEDKTESKEEEKQEKKE